MLMVAEDREERERDEREREGGEEKTLACGAPSEAV